MFGLQLTAEIENAHVPKHLVRLAGSLERPERAMRDFAAGKVRRIRLSMKRAPKGEAAAEGEPPNVHTRDFSRSILFEIERGGRGATVGTTDVRGEILHTGGIIRPRRRKALTVPIHPKAYGKRPRDIPGLVAAGRFLVRNVGRGKRQRSDLMFVFVKQVRIRPHPWLTWGLEDDEALGHALEDQADRELQLRQGGAP
jgi:hypothetical protein